MPAPILPPDWRDKINQRARLPQHRWMRIVARVSLGLTALFALITISVVILFNSQSFHNYLIRTVESQASDSLGVRVQLENFALHLETLSLDLYGITVDGAAPYANPPLIQIDHLGAGVRIVSVFKRTWYLDHLQIDRPIAHVFVDSHGVSNIPTIKSSGNSNSNTTIFDLGIRRAQLGQGEVYYNDQPTPIAADLHDLQLNSTFDAALKKYSGHLGYSDGHLVYGNFQPLGHNLEADFDATPDHAEITQSKLSIGPSQLTLSAALQNFSSPTVHGQYQISIDGGQVAAILHNPSVPAGTIETSGSIGYSQGPGVAPLQALTVNGRLSSPRLDVKTDTARATITNVGGDYALANGDVTLNGVHASLLGGELTAQGTMKNLQGNSHTSLTAALKDISLADAVKLAGPSASSLNVGVTGRLNATAKATWGKTTDDLVAQADATVHGGVSGAPAHTVQVSAVGHTNANAPPAAIPVDSEMNATYRAKTAALSLTRSYLKTPKTSLTMNGTVSNKSNLNLQLQANDLREVETLANLFRTPAPGKPVQPLGLAGTASFQGSVQGSMKAPSITGQLSAANLQVSGTTIKALHTNVTANPSSASLQRTQIDLPSGHITLNASTGLTQWAFTNKSPIEVDLQASQLNIADLAKAAGQTVPVTGVLNTSVKMHGTELNPIGNGNLEVTKLVAYDQPVHSVKLDFNGDGQQVQANLNVELPAGSLQGKATVRPADKTYVAQVSAGGIDLAKLQAIASKNMNLTGVVSLNANGQGTFDNPQVKATVQIPKLVAASQAVSNINLQLDVANHALNAGLTSTAVNTSIQAKAKIDLTGDFNADASLDTQGIPLQPILAAYAPDQAADVTGQTEVHATLHGPLKKPAQLEAHVNIPVLKMTYGSTIQLAATAPIRADYKNNTVTLQRSSIKGTDTDLQFQGSIPTAGDGPMSLLLVGSVNLQLAQLFDPDVRSSGQLRFNIDSNGPVSAAEIGGQIDIVDANYSSADLPVGLQHANGVLKVTKDRVNIASFQGTVGGGTITAQGGVAYRPAVQFDMGLAANNIRLLYPQGMRESFDANLRLAGSLENSTLAGSVSLADLSFTPAFDLTSFIGQFSGGVASPPSQGFAQNLGLNIALRSTSNVNLVSRELSIGGSANLQVRGTAAEPVILGRVDLNDGDIILNGNRFVLTGGTVQFINPSETQPVVNLTLNTSIQQYSIDLRFNGPVDQLATQYSSDPALPSADIINLLAFGTTTEAQTTSPSATSVVASQVSSQVTSRVSRIAGISQLSISPVLAGSSSQGPPGAVVTIQQRVTGNLFVNFSSNVASTQSQTIQGQYKVSPKVSVSATRDPNGGFGFDTLIKKSW